MHDIARDGAHETTGGGGHEEARGGGHEETRGGEENGTSRYHSTGVLVLSHGTPSSLDGIPEFYTAIRRGNPPSPEQLAELTQRYEAIGGTSPLAGITLAQATALRVALGLRVPVALGYRFAEPGIEEAVTRLRDWTADRLIALVMSPQYSTATTEQYFARARDAAGALRGDLGPAEVVAVHGWHLDDAFVAFHAAAIREALVAAAPSPESNPHRRVVFTAHSLPVAALDSGDPYPAQVAETADSVARAAGLDRGEWIQAWQSAGRTADEWIGPDICEVLTAAAADGVTTVVVCPIGFAADNLETLYDLDVQAAGAARELGIAFQRTPVPNADPAVMASLAQRIVEIAISESGGGGGRDRETEPGDGGEQRNQGAGSKPGSAETHEDPRTAAGSAGSIVEIRRR